MLQIILRVVALTSIACILAACSTRSTSAPPQASISSDPTPANDRRSMKGWELYCIRDEADSDGWRFALMPGSNMYLPEKWRSCESLMDFDDLKSALLKLSPFEHVAVIPVSELPPTDVVERIKDTGDECHLYLDARSFFPHGFGGWYSPQSRSGRKGE